MGAPPASDRRGIPDPPEMGVIAMSLGAGILLFVIGAILAFALNLEVDWIDLHLVGYILMGAGVVVVLLALVLMARRRRTVSTSQTTLDPATGNSVRRDETSAPDTTAGY